VAEQGNWIVAVDTGPTLTNQSAGNNNGFESTFIVEIPDDVATQCEPFDLSNSVALSFGNPVSDQRTVPQTRDWGLVDCIADTAGLAVTLRDCFWDVVEIVTPILGALLLSPHKPNVRKHLYGKHTVRVIRHQSRSAGLDISPEERALLKEFIQYKKRLALEEWTDDQASMPSQVSVVEESGDEPHSPKSEKQVAAPVQKKALAKSPGLPLMRRASFQY